MQPLLDATGVDLCRLERCLPPAQCRVNPAVPGDMLAGRSFCSCHACGARGSNQIQTL